MSKIIIPFIAVLLILIFIGAFFGFITHLGKSFREDPDRENTPKASKIYSQSQQFIEDSRREHERKMQDHRMEMERLRHQQQMQRLDRARMR